MLPILSVVFAVIAGLIWFVFLRPVPSESARGVITRKDYKPPGEYVQVHGGARDAFHMPTTISIAEGYVVDIKLDNSHATISSLLNTVEAEQYDVGSRVKVEYSRRSVPMLWHKCYVHSVELAGEV